MENKEFNPYVSAGENRREFTTLAVVAGVVMSIIFGCANAYLGLRLGTTITSSIPAAVIFMGISKLFVKNGSVLENNMVQTIASAGEAVASGSIFTIPAIYFWAYSGIVEPPSMLTLTMIALCGGVLGVLFMIPLREMLIVKEHGVLPYPEGTACAEVLLSAEKKGTSSKNLFVGIILASLIKFVSGSLRVIPETVNFAVKSLRTAAGVEVSPAFIAVGYICGLRVSACLFAGGLLSWFVIIPAISLFGGNTVLYPATVPIAELYAQGGAQAIWSSYIRYIGAGAIATAGIIGLGKNVPVIFRTFSKTLKGLRNHDKSEKIGLVRTEQNLNVKVIGLGILAVAFLLWVTLHTTVGITGVLVMLVASFFFTCVASRIVGLIGCTNNPASSMTIATLIFAIAILKMVGYAGTECMLTAIFIGAVVCTNACVAGNISQDLKTGFILGSTPKKQQMGELIGVGAMALSVSSVLVLLDKAWGFGSSQLPAPQATMMKMIVEGMTAGNLPWDLIVIGAFIAVVIELLGVNALSVAMGTYLPLTLTATMVCGGIIRFVVDTMKKHIRKEKSNDDGSDEGVLFCSGLIAGEGIIGLFLAVSAVLGWSEWLDCSSLLDFGNVGGLAIVAAIMIYIAFVAYKKE